MKEHVQRPEKNTRTLESNPRSSRQVFQLQGERTGVINISLATGINGQRVSRGNRRGSISRTVGDSRARLSAYRDYIKIEEPLGAYAMTLATAAGIPNVANYVRDNWDAISGWVARQSAIGNCGEFGSMLVEELLRTTTNQWVHSCSMYPWSRFDHAFVVTYPNQIPAKRTMPGSVDKRVAIVADAWDGYKVMTVEDFCNGRNAYGQRGLDHQNIYIQSSHQALAADAIVLIKPGLDALAGRFDLWYQGQLALGAANKYYKEKQMPGALNYAFRTRGSDVAGGIQDFRPMSALFPGGPPHDDEVLNARDWWTNPAGTFNVGTINASGWSIFSAASRRDTEIQNTADNVKFGQFLQGASRHEYLRLAEFSNVANAGVKVANLANLNNRIDEQSLAGGQTVYNLLADADVATSLNARTNVEKVRFLEGIQDVKMITYLNTLTAVDCAAILDQLTLDRVAYYFSYTGLNASALVLGQMSIAKLRAFVQNSYTRFFLNALIPSNYPYKYQIIEELPDALALDVLDGESAANQKRILNAFSKNKKQALELEMTRRRAVSGGIAIPYSI